MCRKLCHFIWSVWCFLGQKILKLWRQESRLFGPGWAANITRIHSWTFRLPWSQAYFHQFLWVFATFCLNIHQYLVLNYIKPVPGLKPPYPVWAHWSAKHIKLLSIDWATFFRISWLKSLDTLIPHLPYETYFRLDSQRAWLVLSGNF